MTNQFIQPKAPRHLCKTATALSLTLDAALETHNLAIIYGPLRQYFCHLSGMVEGKPTRRCPECDGYTSEVKR